MGKKLTSMGLVIKPTKCRALPIIKGKTTNIPFFLKEVTTGAPVVISSVIEKPLKFRGSQVTGDYTPMFANLASKLKEKLAKH